MSQTIFDYKNGIGSHSGPYILPGGCELSPTELKERMVQVMDEQQYTAVRFLSFMCEWKEGDKNAYLSKVIDHTKTLSSGEAILVASPTGSGKTSAVIDFIRNSDIPVLYLTNRTATLNQFRRDYIKKTTGRDVPMEMLDIVTLGKNVQAITYQAFVEKAYSYKGMELLLIIDEAHCLLEDAVFSPYAEKFIKYLKANLDNTVRIYLTATPDAITPVITEIESIYGSEMALKSMSWDTDMSTVFRAYAEHRTRISTVYSVKNNWDYINFKFYSPDDTKKLTDYISKANEKNIKSLIFINDISKGKVIQEMLDNTQHIYSDEDKCAEIAEIAKNERFADKNLITTKVAENGLSLHDEELNLIVVETLDPVTLQQVIGRARVNRKKPRDITVLIPDYTYADLGNAIASVSQQLKKAEEVADNPQRAMAYVLENPALVYYDFHVEEPFVNMMAIKALEYQLEFLKKLREAPEDSHAFAHKVLEIYGKNTEITDDMFLDYDNIAYFKSKVNEAFEEYKDSEMNADALEKLKIALKDICNSTKAYKDGKTITSSIQIGTINDILKDAGINAKINPKREVYDISDE